MDSGCAGSPAPRNDQSEFTRVGMTAIDSIVARLTQLHPKRIDLSLERMWRILAALGDPQRRLPPVIHVAGTNGKGSTIAFMRAILEAAGLAVHVYTSPHLVRFNERFRLGAEREGRVVSDEELADALGECERVNAGAPITVFEITTAAALLLFARHRADVLLLEVGMERRRGDRRVAHARRARACGGCLRDRCCQSRLAGAHAALGAGTAPCAVPGWQRALARRQP